MIAACQYPNCREGATTMIVVERTHDSIKRRVCDTHAERAQAIAKLHEGIAYRVSAL